jgi:hypothetical protein
VTPNLGGIGSHGATLRAFLSFRNRMFSQAFGQPAILDLFGEDSQLNVYRGEVEVRAPLSPRSGIGGLGEHPIACLL